MHPSPKRKLIYELTGLDSADWLAISMILFSGFVVAWSFQQGPGRRWLGVRVVPIMGGLVTVGLTVAADPGRLFDALVTGLTSPVAWVVLAGVLLVVVALLNLLLGPFLDSGVNLLGRMNVEEGVATDQVIGVAMAALALGVLAVFNLSDWVEMARGVEPDSTPAASTTLTTTPATSTTLTTVPKTTIATATTAVAPFINGWELQLDGAPLDVAFSEVQNAVFVTIDDGRIVRVDLEQGGGLRASQPIVVAKGLSFPRGIAIVGDRLFVGEMIDLPCDPPIPRCKGEDVAGAVDKTSGEIRILEEARGRIVEYAINKDGSLSWAGVLLEDLPIANSDHGLNGMIAPNGDSVLVSIGNIDRVLFAFEQYEEVEHPNKGLLGTVIRVDVDSGGFEVVATGLRNVYGITSDPFGVVWGADNDGPSLGGVRREEVLRIREGGEFGFPYDGSAPPFQARTDAAAYTLDTEVGGSGGIQWVEEVDGGRGLLLGFAGQVSFLELKEVDGVFKVTGLDAPRTATLAAGFVVAIESINENSVVYAEYGPNRLKLLTWGEHQ